MPDETPRRPVPGAEAGEPPPLDVADGLFEFAEAWPCFMAGGKPLSWRHYVVGMRRLSRAQAGRSLTIARAARAAQVEAKDYERWARTQESQAGLR